MEERYGKYRKLVNNIIPLQIGITCFEFIWDDDSYKVTTFTFPLFKKPILSLDRSFLLQAAAVVFLTENNFDFNKSFYDGIPYLNRIERKLIAEKLKSKNFFYDVLNNIHTQLIVEFNESKATINDWYNRANIGDELHVSIPQSRFKYYQPQVTFLFKTHITSDPTRFLKVYPEDNLKIKVKKVTEDQLKAYGDSLNNKDDYLDKNGGFQTIIEMLISSKKPIIGHNCMIDFMILYNEFIEPLPQSVQEFKRKLHEFFPVIFDTKFITYETKSSFEWDNNSLDSMFKYFNSQPDDVISKFSKPVVLKSDAEGGVDEQFHEAGYDSYCTGCVFLKIAHFLTNEKLTEFTSRSITCFEHLKSIDNMKNNVHLMQCSIPYMKIDGEDPKSQRPKQLYASIKNPSIDLSTDLNVLELNGNVSDKIADIKDNSILALNGTVKVLGKSIESNAKSGSYGVIQRLQLIEHYMARGTAGFWDTRKRMIQDNYSFVPFAICGSRISIEVQEPLNATILDLKEISNQYIQGKSDYMDYLYTFLLGFRSNGFQSIEEMLPTDSKILVIGELIKNENSFIVQAPKKAPFIITHLTMGSLSKRIGDDRNYYCVLSIILGTTSLLLSYFLLTKFLKRRRYRRQVSQIKKNRERSVRTEDIPKELLCVVCMENQKEVLLMNCGHFCLCLDCSSRISDKCPICRGRIVTKTIAFL